MFQVIYSIARKLTKFLFILAILAFFFSYFGQYLVAFVYHINLGMYFFFGAFFSNTTLTLFSIAIVFLLILYVKKLVKKLI